jgi:hypothetical protein
MAKPIWQRGRRLFTTAAILMILTAIAHTMGNLFPPPQGPPEQQLFAAMDAYRAPLGLGMTPSMHDIYTTIVFTMSITFAALGVMNLVIAASSESSATLLRRVTWVNALWVGAFLILTWVCQVPPPLICAVIIEAVIVLGLILRPVHRAA